MIKRLRILAWLSFRDTLRDHLVRNILIAFFLLLLGAQVVESGSLAEDGRVFHDIAHAVLSISGSLVAIFLAIRLIANDIDKKTLHLVLARPVRRGEVVAGKYLGLLGVMALITAACTTLYALVAAGGPTSAPNLSRLISLLVLLAEFAVVAAAAMFFSCLSPASTAAIYAVIFFVVGRLGDAITELAQRWPDAWLRQLAKGMQLLLPDLTQLDWNGLAAPAPRWVGQIFLYALFWVLIFLALGALALSRRDLK